MILWFAFANVNVLGDSASCFVNDTLFAKALSLRGFGINASCQSLPSSLLECSMDVDNSNTAIVNITLINFSNLALSGFTIPSSIGELSMLQHLDLRNASLSGAIPMSFSLLTALTYLDLSGNALFGRIAMLNASLNVW
jgi:hypothetical protein